MQSWMLLQLNPLILKRVWDILVNTWFRKEKFVCGFKLKGTVRLNVRSSLLLLAVWFIDPKEMIVKKKKNKVYRRYKDVTQNEGLFSFYQNMCIKSSRKVGEVSSPGFLFCFTKFVTPKWYKEWMWDQCPSRARLALDFFALNTHKILSCFDILDKISYLYTYFVNKRMTACKQKPSQWSREAEAVCAFEPVNSTLLINSRKAISARYGGGDIENKIMTEFAWETSYIYTDTKESSRTLR